MSNQLKFSGISKTTLYLAKQKLAMRLLQLTIAFALISFTMGSCSQEIDDVTILSKKAVVLDGSQEVPAKSTAANGTMDYAYNRTTRVMTYTVRWNSLTGVPVGMHIHGTAGRGFNAGVVQNFSGFTSAVTGSYTGTFFVDGVAVREEDLLRGAYYVNIHTQLNPGGEIRGQIEFDN